MSNKPDWPSIKAEYIGGTVSMRSLAERHGICFSTLSKRAKREAWHASRQRRTALAAAGLREALEAKQEGREAGMSALAFLKRSIQESEVWLRRIQDLADSGQLDAKKLKTLLESWRMVHVVARETFGLDAMTRNGRPAVPAVALAIKSGGDVYIHPAQRMAVPLKVIRSEPKSEPPS
jgi:transposase-like protein